MDDERIASGFRTMETVLAHLRRAGRAAGRPQRLVAPGERSWASDLAISDQLIEDVQTAKHTRLRWRGAALLKDPFDLAIYPQLLAELRPATIIELGAWEGGSAAWLADHLAMFDIDGHVYSLDVNLARVKVQHPRVTFVPVDLHDLATLATPSFGPWVLRTLPHPWLVIEDAHVNVYEVLRFFDRSMRSGDYVIAEDLIDRSKHDEVRRFAIDHGYRVDTAWSDLFGFNVTWNLNGFLRKD